MLLSYGKLSNDFLLMDYGFVVANNEYDRVALRFDIELVKVRAVDGYVTQILFSRVNDQLRSDQINHKYSSCSP